MVMIMIIREYRYKVLISWVVSHWVMLYLTRPTRYCFVPV